MLDAAVVADAIGISRSQLYALANAKQLPFPAHRFGKLLRFRRIDVETFLGQPLEVTQ